MPEQGYFYRLLDRNDECMERAGPYKQEDVAERAGEFARQRRGRAAAYRVVIDVVQDMEAYKGVF